MGKNNLDELLERKASETVPDIYNEVVEILSELSVKSLFAIISSIEKYVKKPLVYNSDIDADCCSVCGTVAHGPYCYNCGQTLEWKEEKTLPVLEMTDEEKERWKRISNDPTFEND